MRRFVLTGTSGFLGQFWLGWLEGQEGVEVISAGRTSPPGTRPPNATHLALDLSNADAAVERLAAWRPYAIIHLATSSEAAEAMAVTVAEASRMCRAKAVLLSCDRVFDGRPGPAGEESAPDPASDVGKALRAAELAVEARCDDRLIVRTSCLFGWGPRRPDALLARWQSRWGQGGVVQAPVDVTATPTWIEALPRAVHGLLRRDGTFHVAGPDRVSLYRLAQGLALALDLTADRVKGMEAVNDPSLYGTPFEGGLVSSVRLPSLEQAIPDIARQIRRQAALR